MSAITNGCGRVETGANEHKWVSRFPLFMYLFSDCQHKQYFFIVLYCMYLFFPTALFSQNFLQKLLSVSN
jgi:hypothetical protein